MKEGSKYMEMYEWWDGRDSETEEDYIWWAQKKYTLGALGK
jgi:hypothetical protein